MPEKLLSIQEVAEIIPNVSVPTLRYWKHNGKGPKAAKIGRHLVYRESDVYAWLAAQFDDDKATA